MKKLIMFVTVFVLLVSVTSAYACPMKDGHGGDKDTHTEGEPTA